MADLAGQDRRAARPACAARSPCCSLVVFGIKAALFPLFFWLPDSYPTAPSPVTAVFAGLLTKVGVYAIIRTQTLLFPPTPGRPRCCSSLAGAHDGGRRPRRHRPGRREADPVVPHRQPDRLHGDGPRRSSPSPGSPAAVFYIVHHIVVKTALFLAGGLDRARRRIEPAQPRRRHGPDRADARGAVPRSRRSAWPGSRRSRASSPSSRSSRPASRRSDVRRSSASASLVSLLTLFVDDQDLDRACSGARPTARSTGTPRERRAAWAARPLMVGPDGRARRPHAWPSPSPAGPLYAYCQRTAADLLDPTGYIDAVLDR